jgi:hypothetical protein
MVEVHADGRILIRELSGGGGSHGSQSSSRLHFGLGTISEIDSVSVIWPGGGSETFFPTINQYNTLIEGVGTGQISRDETPFLVWPQPAKTHLNIESNLLKPGAEVYLLGITGRQVLKTTASTHGRYRLSLPSSIANGAYFVEIRNNEQAKRQLVVIAP